MRNMLIQETPLIEGAMRVIDDLLPESWTIELSRPLPSADFAVDGRLTLVGPSGQSSGFLVEGKTSVNSVSSVLRYLRELARGLSERLLFVTDYAGPTLRAALEAEGISYADTTGWVRLISDSPLILLTGQGADKSPRAGKPSAATRLNGLAAGRIVRALCEFKSPIGVRELSRVAAVSPGSTSKVVSTLTAEGAIERGDRGAITSVRKRALVRRWIRDYSFERSNRSVGCFIATRGIERTLAKLGKLGEPFAVTGSVGARQVLPDDKTSVVPLRLLAIYTRAGAAGIEGMGLIPAEPSDANVYLASPQDPDILAAEVAPIGLILADLLTLPGRGDAEADQLMDMLARQDPSWED